MEILVVEDEVGIADFLTRGLRAEGGSTTPSPAGAASSPTPRTSRAAR
jgi:DNA-binding response OmpR family regulator